MNKESGKATEKSRLKGWAGLAAGVFVIWFFGFVLGPAVQDNVTTFSKIAKVVEERDIDSGAYFYTEIKASYEGEAYLRQALQSGAPDQFGFTLPFISGIVLCLVILAFGYKYILPLGTGVREPDAKPGNNG
jgi:hypothetical protein